MGKQFFKLFFFDLLIHRFYFIQIIISYKFESLIRESQIVDQHINERSEDESQGKLQTSIELNFV